MIIVETWYVRKKENFKVVFVWVNTVIEVVIVVVVVKVAIKMVGGGLMIVKRIINEWMELLKLN